MKSNVNIPLIATAAAIVVSVATLAVIRTSPLPEGGGKLAVQTGQGIQNAAYAMTMSLRAKTGDATTFGPSMMTNRVYFSDTQHFRIESNSTTTDSYIVQRKSGALSLYRSIQNGITTDRYSEENVDDLPAMIANRQDGDEIKFWQLKDVWFPIQSTVEIDDWITEEKLLDLGNATMLGRSARGIKSNLGAGSGGFEVWYDQATGIKLKVIEMRPGEEFLYEAEEVDDSLLPEAGEVEFEVDEENMTDYSRTVELSSSSGVPLPVEARSMKIISPTDQITSYIASRPIFVSDTQQGPTFLLSKWSVMQELEDQNGKTIAVIGALPNYEIQALMPFWPLYWQNGDPTEQFPSLFLGSDEITIGSEIETGVFETRCLDGHPYMPKYVITWEQDGLVMFVAADCQHTTPESVINVATILSQ